MNDNQDSLAMELLKELKASSQRWFRAFVIMTIMEIVTIIAFIIYCSIPVEQTNNSLVTQEGEDLIDTQFIGGDYNGQGPANNN